ncbi:MAG: VWA domain-containing protein, partial [Proteobacteria bacterium]|nr:VWA domain-containing protein [Pseudomonadota bacterium]
MSSRKNADQMDKPLKKDETGPSAAAMFDNSGSMSNYVKIMREFAGLLLGRYHRIEIGAFDDVYIQIGREVSRLNARGCTNLSIAFDTMLNLVNNGLHIFESGNGLHLFFVTDGGHNATPNSDLYRAVYCLMEALVEYSRERSVVFHTVTCGDYYDKTLVSGLEAIGFMAKHMDAGRNLTVAASSSKLEFQRCTIEEASASVQKNAELIGKPVEHSYSTEGQAVALATSLRNLCGVLPDGDARRRIVNFVKFIAANADAKKTVAAESASASGDTMSSLIKRFLATGTATATAATASVGKIGKAMLKAFEEVTRQRIVTPPNFLRQFYGALTDGTLTDLLPSGALSDKESAEFLEQLTNGTPVMLFDALLRVHVLTKGNELQFMQLREFLEVRQTTRFASVMLMLKDTVNAEAKMADYATGLLKEANKACGLANTVQHRDAHFYKCVVARAPADTEEMILPIDTEEMILPIDT